MLRFALFLGTTLATNAIFAANAMSDTAAIDNIFRDLREEHQNSNKSIVENIIRSNITPHLWGPLVSRIAREERLFSGDDFKFVVEYYAQLQPEYLSNADVFSNAFISLPIKDQSAHWFEQLKLWLQPAYTVQNKSFFSKNTVDYVHSPLSFALESPNSAVFKQVIESWPLNDNLIYKTKIIEEKMAIDVNIITESYTLGGYLGLQLNENLRPEISPTQRQKYIAAAQLFLVLAKKHKQNHGSFEPSCKQEIILLATKLKDLEKLPEGIAVENLF